MPDVYEQFTTSLDLMSLILMLQAYGTFRLLPFLYVKHIT